MQCPTESIAKIRYNILLQYTCKILRKKRHTCCNIHYVKSVQIRSFFWFVFYQIRTEYGEILRISQYSVQMQENTDQKKLFIWTHFTL